jgi:hypothetical protein
MKWGQGAAWALVIFAYFAVFTVWLPSRILHLSAVASAPAAIHDLAGAGAWLALFVIGMWALRRLQSRGRI